MATPPVSNAWRLGDLPKLPEISAYALVVTLARGLRLIRGSKTKYLRQRLRYFKYVRS